MEEIKNYFILLGLDPDVTDEKTIQAEIRKKQAQWSREANTHPDPEIKRTAQQCLKNLDAIKKILLDPKARAEEARKAKQEIQKLRDSKRQEFEDAVELLSKGNVTEQAIKNLAAKFKSYYYTEKDIRETLNQFEAFSTASDESAEEGAQGLDPSTAAAIRKNLNILKKESLYDFLRVTSEKELALEALLERTREIDRELKKITTITPENDAKRELIGHCLVIFKNEKSRKRYEQSLADEQLTPLLEMIDSICDTNSVEIGQLLMVLRKGKQHKISIQKILQLVRSKAKKRKVPINIAENLTFENSVRCVCKNVNQPLSERCEKCGKSLYHKCLKCGLATPVDSLACVCGFSLQEAYDKLRAAFESGQEERFLSLWDEKTYRHHPAFNSLSKEYDAIKKRVEKKRQAERAARERIDRLKSALAKNDDLEIIQAWDETLLESHPELKQYLPRIKQAHQPPDVKQVEAVHHGSYIQIRWELLDHIHQYIVVWSISSFQRYPPKGEFKSITRGEYERAGFRIENPVSRNHYITVYSAILFRGEELVSAGSSEGCRALVPCQDKFEIRYSLRFKGIFKKSSAVLTLKSNQNIGSIPELVLVARHGNIVPVDIQSGVIVHRLAGIKLNAGALFERSFTVNGVSSPARFRLFVSDPEEREIFKLLPDSSARFKI